MSDSFIHTLIRDVIERIEWEAELEHPGYGSMPPSLPPMAAATLSDAAKNLPAALNAGGHRIASPSTTGNNITTRPPATGNNNTTPPSAKGALGISAAPQQSPRQGTPDSRQGASLTAAKPVAPPIGQDRAHAMAKLKFDLEKCTACALSQHRSRIVFSDGTMTARIAFVGEFPSREEDMVSLPFIGQRGHLLNKIILAIGQRRDTSYLCNVIKCSPQAGRSPSTDEVHSCSKYLFEQLSLVEAEIIVALGQTAANVLLNRSEPLDTLRGKFHKWRETPVMPTWSLDDMLATPTLKRDVWSDLKQVKALLDR